MGTPADNAGPVPPKGKVRKKKEKRGERVSSPLVEMEKGDKKRRKPSRCVISFLGPIAITKRGPGKKRKETFQ